MGLMLFASPATLPHRQVLVVPAPEREARVIAQWAHVHARFLAHWLAELARIRAERAGKRKILPDPETEPGKQFVEVVAPVQPAAPDWQHVHSAFTSPC